MPACQQIMSVTVSGPFTIGPTSSPSLTSSHQRGSAPRARFARVLRLDLVDLLVGVRRELDRVVLLASRAPSRARCGPSAGTGPRAACPSSSRNTCAVHSWTARPGELARLVEHGDERVAAEHPALRVQRRPPLAGARRVERVHAAQRIALHQVAVLGRDRGHLVLADQRVAADQRRRRDRRSPSGSSAP